MTAVLLSVRLAGVPAGSGRYSEWLKVIHSINRSYTAEHPDQLYIGQPVETGGWWAGGWYEEYPEFRVILRNDGTTNVQAKTPAAVAALKAAVLDVTGAELDDNGCFK